MADSKLIEKLEKLDSRLDSIDVTLAKQAKDLEYHIKRTDLLEQDMSATADSITRSMEPVLKHINRVESVSWFFAKLGGVLIAILTIYKLLD